MKRNLLGLVILLLLLFVPLMLHAATAGKFTSVEGNVDITSPGRVARPVNSGDPVDTGDIIRTKSKSRCEVTFPDGNILRLAENSRLRVNEFVQEKEQRNATLDLFRGKILNIIVSVKSEHPVKSKYEVRTPTATVGVRGTVFFVYYQAGVTGAAFREGSGYGYSINRPEDVRTIHAGQIMTVSDPNLPPVIRPATAVEMDRHEKETAPSEKPKSGVKEEKSESGPVDNVEKTIETPTSAELPVSTEAAAPSQTAPATALTSGSSGAGSVIVVPVVNTSSLNISPQLTPDTFSDATRISNQSDATFTVLTGESSAVYSSLDGGDYVPVDGDKIQLSALSEGSHILSVKSVDSAGNASPVSSYSWTTDYTAPAITLSGTPDPVTNEDTAFFVVTPSEPATVAYTLNDVTVPSPNLTYLPEGSNTFTATATDSAGNVSPVSSYSWTTDYTAPAITLSGTPDPVTNESTADFVVAHSEPATLTYALNGVPAASPNLTDLPEGVNTFSVAAADSLGNTSTVSYSWTIDYTGPVLTLEPKKAYPGAGGSSDAEFNLLANEPGTSISANVVDAYTEETAGSATVSGSTVTVTGLVSGAYILKAQGVDPAGNPAEESLTFTLNNYALTGSFDSSIGNVSGTATGRVAGISGESWGGWKIDMTGAGNPIPNADWTVSAGGGNTTDGYWISIAPGATNFGDNTLWGDSQFNYLSVTKLGFGTGTVTGVYDGAGNYTLSDTGAGSYTQKPLLYGNRIEGDLYQQNNATLHIDSYRKPVSYSFYTMDLETMYVKSQNPANLPRYGLQMVQKEIGSSYGVELDNFDTYYPNDEAFSYTSSSNVPRIYWFLPMTSKNISVQPDLSTSPPTMPLPAEFGSTSIIPNTFLGNAWPVTTAIVVGTTQYARTFESDYDTNVMERVLPPLPAQFDQTFTGIMGTYQLDDGVSDLWSSDSGCPLGLYLLGVHQDAELPLVFRLRRFYSQDYAVSGFWPAPTPDGGAYFGVLSGTLSSDRSLDATLYGLYVSPNNGGIWEAGLLKTTMPLTGSSYAGINMWDASGEIYRIPKAFNLSAPNVEAIHLLDLDASNYLINIFYLSMGDPSMQHRGIYGRFDTGGSITTFAGGSFGKTHSIKGLPDFGIFEMLHGGLDNTYTNPSSAWRMDMASTGQFGRYIRSDLSNYSDSGFWTASINDGALNSDKLYGTLDGYFLTYKKEGTLTGDFLGNLKPDTATTGIWQGASVGAWEKTRDVAFSSGIVGGNFELYKEIVGNGETGSYYVGLNPDGSVSWAESFTTGGSVITGTEYDSFGPTDQIKYSKTVWVMDTESGPFTLQEAGELTLAEFNAAIAALRIYQGTSGENTDSYDMYDDQHDGILAGFDTLWNTGGGIRATNVSLIGMYEEEGRAPTIFGGTTISFDPMYSMNPYYNITSNPNGSRSPLGGAYAGFLGAAFGKQAVAADWMDGLINGLYLDPGGNAGIFSGTFTGNNNPQISAWTGAGTIDGGYGMGTAGSGLTEANFANMVYTSNSNWSYGVDDIVVTGDDVQHRVRTVRSALISNSLLSPSGSGYWGVWQVLSGGIYSGTPTAWSTEAEVYGIRTDYFNVLMNAEETNGIKTGDVVVATVVYDSNPGNTWIAAGTIKGLFDPVESTWQAVAQGVLMDTTAFVNKVAGMDNTERQAFTEATKIPCFAVGTTDLRGSGSVTGGTINLGDLSDTTRGVLNTAFYASSAGGKPQIFASGNVNGGYTGSPTGGSVNLSGYAPGGNAANGISATFNIEQWTGSKWGASVSGSAPAGSVGGNAAPYNFQGGAAGGINSGNSTFSGTAAGIVK